MRETARVNANIYWLLNKGAYMKIFLTANFLVIIFLGISKDSAEELVPIGLQEQLLVDDYVISHKHNITRELGQPVKLGVVMSPSVPTDFDPVKQFPGGLPKTGGYYAFGFK
jgi:hypothetical protein